MQALDAGSGWVENVVWSPDGQWLAASCSRQVRVFNEDGQEIWQSDDHPTTVSIMDTTTRMTNLKQRPKVVCPKVNFRQCKCKHQNQAIQILNKNQHGVLNFLNLRFVIN